MRGMKMVVGLALALLLASGCGDDEVNPETFALTLEVVDPGGMPVPGLMLSVLADLPFYQDGRQAAEKAACVIPFTLPVPARCQLVIHDAEGAVVSHLVDDDFQAGVHQVQWSEADDSGQQVLSGAYLARLTAWTTDTDSLLGTLTTGMYLAIMDFQRENAGVTDSSGRITLTDRRLFPSLLGVEDMAAMDESGQRVGTITFDGSMRFTFADTAGGGSMRYSRVVTGSGVLKFVWEPRSQVDQMMPAASGIAMDEPPPGVFSLGPVFPNPFN